MLEIKSIRKKSKTSVKRSLEKQNRQNVLEETGKAKISHYIAGRLPENSRNRFVDRQSKETVKIQTKKIRLFIED